jgi:enamine deaminase RidA (YjgF/YER057c/UK114 family)
VPRGYANGMVAQGRVLVTGGLVGWDEQGAFAKGFLPQIRQTLLNIKAVVEAGGGRIEDIVRLTWYVTDIEAYRASLKELGPVYREVLGRHFPAMAVVQVVSLVEPEAMVEIEATAVIA